MRKSPKCLKEEGERIIDELTERRELLSNSNKISSLLRPHKESLTTLRALSPFLSRDFPNCAEREENFDKIISHFEAAKLRPQREQQVTERSRVGGSSVNQSICTERLKENLSRLRSHYCLLPQLPLLQLRQENEQEAEDDYEQFHKGNSGGKGKTKGGRRPLGIFNLGRLKGERKVGVEL